VLSLMGLSVVLVKESAIFALSIPVTFSPSFGCLIVSSVLSGLMVMNTYTIKVVEDLKDHCDAMQNYTWKQRDGVPIDEPDHTWSHIPDSVRYGNEDTLKGYGGASFSHS
jgi:hypothetical protein